jgi:hypothetical protein
MPAQMLGMLGKVKAQDLIKVALPIEFRLSEGLSSPGDNSFPNLLLPKS